MKICYYCLVITIGIVTGDSSTSIVDEYVEQARELLGSRSFDDYVTDLHEEGVDTVELDVETDRNEYHGVYTSIYRPVDKVDVYAQVQAEGVDDFTDAAGFYLLGREDDDLLNAERQPRQEALQEAEAVLDDWQAQLETEGFDVER